MQASLTIILFAVCLVCGAAGFGVYQAKIPNGENVMRNGQGWPGVGHVRPEGGPSDKNPFGIAFSTAGFEWTQELCQQDSDGDGQSNGFELGDPACSWTAGSIPERSSDISHPGFSDSVVAPSFPTVTTTLVTTTTTASVVRALSHNCTFVIAELDRRQLSMFGSESPFIEADSSKHTPSINISGEIATVVVGIAASHPMTASNDPDVVHWMSHIYVQDQNGRAVFLKMLAPTSPSPAEVSFTIPTGVTSLTPYAFCNKHGLYVGAPVLHQGLGAFSSGCSVDTTDMNSAIDLSTSRGQLLAQSLVAEMRRRQWAIFSTPTAFYGPAVSLKHTPYIVLSDSDVSVYVGKGAETGNASDFHPMSPSTRLGSLHFVNFMYVLDEQDTVVAMTVKFPDDPAPASLRFNVLASTRILTAYEFCNQHGLYQGPSVSMPSPTTTTTTPGACDFVVAELYRRQIMYFGSEMPYSEAESEKHTPFIIVSGRAAIVRVGNATLHPMTASNDSGVVHWITHIFVQDQDGRTLFVKMLAPISSTHAEVSFDIPTGVTSLVAYAFCNRHGLYASPPVACMDSDAVAAAVVAVATTTCMVDTAAISTTVDLSSASGQMLAQALVAEMHRRQLSVFEASAPFTEEMSTKHAPYILLGGSEAVVFVGKGALTGNAADIHPMSASSSPFIVHFVNFVYVLDEDGVVIAMTPKSPDDPAPATLNFSVPVGINYATAYEFCNQHGLYRGPTIRVGAYRGGGVDLFAKDEDKDDDQVIEVLGLELDLALLMAVGGATSAALFCTCLAVCCICHRHRVWTDKKVESALEPGSTAKVQEIVEAPRPVLLGDLASDYGDVLDALSPSRLECAIKIVTALHGGQTPKGLTPKHANFQAA